MLSYSYLYLLKFKVRRDFSWYSFLNVLSKKCPKPEFICWLYQISIPCPESITGLSRIVTQQELLPVRNQQEHFNFKPEKVRFEISGLRNLVWNSKKRFASLKKLIIAIVRSNLGCGVSSSKDQNMFVGNQKPEFVEPRKLCCRRN